MAGELQQLCTGFAEQRGLPLPTADSRGEFRFVLDGYLEVRMSQTGDQLVMESGLTSLPEGEEAREQLLAQCLRHQLGRSMAHGEVVSIDPKTKELVVFQRVKASELDPKGFESLLEMFTNALDFWLGVVAKMPRSTAARMAPPMAAMIRP